MKLSKKKVLVALISFLSFCQTISAGEAERAKERDEIKTLWNNRQYPNVNTRAKAYLKIDVRADVAYWLGTSLCRTNQKSEGQSYLFWIRDNVGLSDEESGILDSEIDICGQTINPRSLPRPKIIGSFGNLKDFTDKKRIEDTLPAATKFIVSDELFSDEALINRLVKIDNPQLAIKKIKDMFAPKTPRVLQVGKHFMLVCVSCKNKDFELNTIGQGLENHLNFFISEYQMKEPEEFFTVYATDESFFNELAEKVHGISLGFQIIGYSIPSDMSMVVILPSWNTKLYGTLKHELFHLMNRTNFGEAPPWIEEGIAALYEISHLEKGRVVGDRNWREEVLRRGFKRRPSVKKLISMKWLEFNDKTPVLDASSDPIDRFSNEGINHAMARYFALYLQNKGKLSEIYNKMRNREITESAGIKQPDAEKVLEESLSMKIDKIDQDFVAWFNLLNKK